MPKMFTPGTHEKKVASYFHTPVKFGYISPTPVRCFVSLTEGLTILHYLIPVH